MQEVMQEKYKEEFEKAQKPFELLQIKTDEIIKSERTTPEKIEQIKILSNAFSNFLKKTKREDVQKELKMNRLEHADQFAKAADALFKTYTDEVLNKYSTHLLNAGVDVTELTRT
ncbi:MAG: hypothetical protein ACP5KJ_04005, partial [Candidatus Micrarchaeia archaeon]